MGIQPYAAPTGRLECDPTRAWAVFAGLATGERPWLWPGCGPKVLPLPPRSWEKLLEIVGDQEAAYAAAREAGTTSWPEWGPDVEVCDDGCPMWHSAGTGGRWVRLTQAGTLSWDTGTGRPSRFIGSLLVAATPVGVLAPGVELREEAGS